MKFSLIIPVYNVEKYLDKCLESILYQSYENFEVIIVNDGSPDNSQEIIDKYVQQDTRFKSYIKENGGLSDARNFGVSKAQGDYLLFIDSDDYIEHDLLSSISDICSGNDIIKFNITLVDEHYDIIKKARKYESKADATFEDVLNVDLFQPACGYAYSTDFWKNNKFEFAKGKIHEDFGLIPYCTLIAKKRYLLDYYGYNYLQRTGSIMNGAHKAKRRAYDMLFHFDTLVDRINNISDASVNKKDKNLCLSYIANNTISMIRLLDDKNKQEYLKELKKRKITKYMLADTFPRKVKKIIASISLETYIKYRFK